MWNDVPWNRFKPPSKIFLLTVPRRCFFCGTFMLFIYVLFLLCFRARLFIDALWSTAGKGLASWLLFVMSNCEVVTFPLVRCGAWLYRILIFDIFLILMVVSFNINCLIRFWSDLNEISMANANVNALYAGSFRIKPSYFLFRVILHFISGA